MLILISLSINLVMQINADLMVFLFAVTRKM
jgi:hypothetical protein